MDVMIQSAVSTVHIHINGRINHRMIQRGVEHGFFILRAFYFKLTERTVPAIGCRSCYLLKRFSACFGCQIFQSALRTDGGKSYLDNQLR